MTCAMALCWYEARRGAIDLADLGGHVSPDIVTNMTAIAEQAIELEATHLFVFETDNTFPPNALERLLAHDLPMVGAAYVKKGKRLGMAGTPMDKSMTQWPTEGMVPMRVIGFGCLLISIEVMHKIGKPYFFNYPRSNGQMMIHDEVFCSRVLDAGFEIWADAALSRQVGHIGPMEYRLGPEPMIPAFAA